MRIDVDITEIHPLVRARFERAMKAESQKFIGMKRLPQMDKYVENHMKQLVEFWKQQRPTYIDFFEWLVPILEKLEVNVEEAYKWR